MRETRNASKFSSEINPPTRFRGVMLS